MSPEQDPTGRRAKLDWLQLDVIKAARALVADWDAGRPTHGGALRLALAALPPDTNPEATPWTVQREDDVCVDSNGDIWPEHTDDVECRRCGAEMPDQTEGDEQ